LAGPATKLSAKLFAKLLAKLSSEFCGASMRGYFILRRIVLSNRI
jgi:hypothetical protein